MNKICVYCGSSPGRRPEYLSAAQSLGRVMAEKGIGLVYGGARIGVMAAIANSVLENNGEVTGVMPRFLVEREVAHKELTELRIVESMHERKKVMVELADGFIALPGGLGTLDELFETLTWAQLGLHHKPCGLLNICSYYDDLLNFLDNCTRERFVGEDHRKMLLVENSAEVLIEKLANYQAQPVDKLLNLA